MRKTFALIPLVVFGVLAAAFALNLGRDSRVVPSAMIGRPAPEFVLPALPGRTRGLSNADFAQNQVSVLNVFASWCIPCRAELPYLQQLAETTGVPIYGLNYKEKNPEDGAAFLAKYGDPYTLVGMDLSGRTAIDFGVYGIPETFLIDRDGRIRYRHVGPITPQILKRDILPRLAELTS